MTNKPVDIELVISETILGTSGVLKKYGTPTIAPPEMNKELDALYHDSVRRIKALISDITIQSRIDECMYLINKSPDEINERIEELEAQLKAEVKK